MTNSLDNINEDIEKIQKNMLKATMIAKNIPEKIKVLLENSEELKRQIEAFKKTKTDLENKIVQINNTLLENKNEFDEKIKSGENRIVSLQRELDLAKEDIKRLNEQISTKNDKINLLESQNKELNNILRQKTL